MELIIFLQIFMILCIFVIGSLFGSFLSLATYRIPRHEDIVATRSYCPNCKHRLNFFDLIPVFSYLLRGGKCKYCHKEISPRYFLLETGNGIIFVLFYFMFGYTIKFFIISIIYVLIFLVIGSIIMKNKMTDEELKFVNEKIKNKKDNKNERKTNKKSGVFISEIIVAVLLFITLMITAFSMSRNSLYKTRNNIYKANANYLAVQNMEFCLATDYDKLSSYTLNEKIDGVSYNINVDVTKISDKEFQKEDIVKKIDIKINYIINGNENEYSLSSLKGKVL